jgi:hypothetical protein
MYCGNKANHISIIEGTRVLGTNYQCMKKGIGVGLHLPYDSEYSEHHIPVDPRKFYCGNADVPPVAGDYLAVGSPSKCLSVGIGVGKSMRAGMGPPYGMNFVRYYLPYILFLFIIIGIFSILYFTKPQFVTKKDENNNNVIDKGKFIPSFMLVCLVIAIIIWWFWKRYIRRWF